MRKIDDGVLISELLLLNLIVALLYLVLHLKKNKRKRGFLNFVFFLVFPIVGEMFMLLAAVMRKILERMKKQGLNMSELSFSKKRMKLRQSGDVEKELNAVPIEEALIVSDKSDKRSTFLDVLKSGYYGEMMGQIQRAVENDDMEVAHYAATFVADSIAKFKANEAEQRKQIEEESTPQKLAAYVDFISDNLKPDILSAAELRTYVERMDAASVVLNESESDYLTASSVTQLVEFWVAVGDSEKADFWIQWARSQCRESLECIKLCFRYYFKNGDRSSLDELYKEVKASSVQLDGETLDWIRILQMK